MDNEFKEIAENAFEDCLKEISLSDQYLAWRKSEEAAKEELDLLRKKSVDSLAQEINMHLEAKFILITNDVLRRNLKNALGRGAYLDEKLTKQTHIVNHIVKAVENEENVSSSEIYIKIAKILNEEGLCQV